MAESEDTPKVPESLPDELDNAVEQGGNPEPGAPAEPEAPQLPPKERRAARRAQSRDAGGAAGAGGPKSPEERDAARLERRAQNAKLRRNYRQRAKTKRETARAEAPEAEVAVAEPASEGRPKVRQGVVVSDKADKTIVVRIDVSRRHRRYGKILRSSSKLHVHDERNDAGTGDTVRVVESRPMSATKRWRLVEVTEKAR